MTVPRESAPSRSDAPARRVEIIGHRGAPREALENTVASFERALAHGVDAIELDVHATADGTVVVHHDPVIGAGAHGSIAGRAIETLSRAELDAARRDSGSLAPPLADVLDLLGDRAIAYVEIKGARIEAAVVQTVQRSRTECAVHAFDHRAVLRVRALAPRLPTGILLEARLVDPVGVLRAARATDYWQQWRMIDEELVVAVHGAGGRVIAWTVNDTAVAGRLIGLGVDGLCTDLPGDMLALPASGR